MRRVGRSLKRAHYKRVMVPARKQTAHKLSRIKSSLSSIEGIPGPLYQPDSTCSNRQHYSTVPPPLGTQKKAMLARYSLICIYV